MQHYEKESGWLGKAHRRFPIGGANHYQKDTME